MPGEGQLEERAARRSIERRGMRCTGAEASRLRRKREGESAAAIMIGGRLPGRKWHSQGGCSDKDSIKCMEIKFSTHDVAVDAHGFPAGIWGVAEERPTASGGGASFDKTRRVSLALPVSERRCIGREVRWRGTASTSLLVSVARLSIASRTHSACCVVRNQTFLGTKFEAATDRFPSSRSC